MATRSSRRSRAAPTTALQALVLTAQPTRGRPPKHTVLASHRSSSKQAPAMAAHTEDDHSRRVGPSHDTFSQDLAFANTHGLNQRLNRIVNICDTTRAIYSPSQIRTVASLAWKWSAVHNCYLLHSETLPFPVRLWLAGRVAYKRFANVRYGFITITPVSDADKLAADELLSRVSTAPPRPYTTLQASCCQAPSASSVITPFDAYYDARQGLQPPQHMNKINVETDLKIGDIVTAEVVVTRYTSTTEGVAMAASPLASPETNAHEHWIATFTLRTLYRMSDFPALLPQMEQAALGRFGIDDSEDRFTY